MDYSELWIKTQKLGSYGQTPGDKLVRDSYLPSKKIGQTRPIHGFGFNNHIQNDEELVYVKHEEKILKELKENPEGLTTKELKKLIGISRDATYGICQALVAAGKLAVEKKKIDGKIQNIYKTPFQADISDINKVLDFEEFKQGVKEKAEISLVSVNPVNDYEEMWIELRNQLIRKMKEYNEAYTDGLSAALNIMVDIEYGKERDEP